MEPKAKKPSVEQVIKALEILEAWGQYSEPTKTSPAEK